MMVSRAIMNKYTPHIAAIRFRLRTDTHEYIEVGIPHDIYVHLMSDSRI
jgi:hypothetical protein